MTTALQQLQHQLIVSVQADATEPLYPTPILTALCESVLQGGAKGLRLANPQVMKHYAQQRPCLPTIGLHKPTVLPSLASDVPYITATLADALQIASTGVAIVAIDATSRPRPDGLTLAQTVQTLRQAYPQVQLMADVDTLAHGLQAVALGFDCVGTTLAGYTLASQATSPKQQPDYDLLDALVKETPNTPIILEGRVWEPWQVHKAFEYGAYSVVIGSAITRPHHITQRFCQALPSSL